MGNNTEKIKSAAEIDFKVMLVLNEVEARALFEITAYGSKPFLDWFYRNLGRS